MNEQSIRPIRRGAIALASTAALALIVAQEVRSPHASAAAGTFLESDKIVL